MLGELTEDIAIDLCAGFGGVDREFKFVGSNCERSQRKTHEKENKQKREAVN
jgi:hypothetical protein